MLLTTSVASFTRPNNTTAYASGQLIANDTAAGSVTPMSFPIAKSATGQTLMLRARISKTGTGTSGATFRIHFYEASPTAANGDGAAWSTNKAASYLGNIDVAVSYAMTDGAAGFGSAAAGAEMRLRLSVGSTIYGLLEARGAYTPTAQEVITVTLECLDGY